MRIISCTLLLFAILFLNGCTESINNSVSLSNQAVPIDINASIVLIAAPDAVDQNGQFAKGSGAAVTAIFLKVMRRYFPFVYVAKANSLSSESLLQFEKIHQIEYIFMPAVTKWNDYRTFWTGAPDSLSLFLAIYRVDSDDQIASIKITSQGANIAPINAKIERLVLPAIHYLFQQITINRSIPKGQKIQSIKKEQSIEISTQTSEKTNVLLCKKGKGCRNKDSSAVDSTKDQSSKGTAKKTTPKPASTIPQNTAPNNTITVKKPLL